MKRIWCGAVLNKCYRASRNLSIFHSRKLEFAYRGYHQDIHAVMPPQRKRRATAQPKNYTEDADDTEETPSPTKQQKASEDTKREGAKASKPKKNKSGPQLPEGVEVGFHEPHDISDAKEKGLFHQRKGNFRVVSWNVNGVRALLKKGDLLKDYVENEEPDVLCLAETKIADKDLEKLGQILPGYYEYWNNSKTKQGYSGVACFAKKQPLNVSFGIGTEKHDAEGRSATMEFDHYYVVTAYVPNSGAELVRLGYRTQEWDPAFREYLQELKRKKPVILCGDLNVAHLDMDIHDPVSNRNKSAGFCDSERENFSTLLKGGFRDVFREKYPNQQQFTFWGYRFNLREKNKGWKLDYTVVSEDIAEKVQSVFVRWFVRGSDHVPVGVDIQF